MFRVSAIIVLTGLAVSTGANASNAAVRSYFSPAEFGDRIAFCATGNEVCGKPVADAWCAKNGFDKAILFQRGLKSDLSATSYIRYADSGKICTGEDCVSFVQIKCYSGE